MFNSSTMSHCRPCTFRAFLVSFNGLCCSSTPYRRNRKENLTMWAGTWFYPGKGNCGYIDGNNDKILAMSKSFYDANGGSNCNQWVSIVNEGNGKSAYGLLRDSCESCGWDDIDMSPGLFEELDDLSTGELTVKWHFMAKSWSP
ncbi:uncharacterized protein EV420DRAFT_1040451 [Desarmillaria tabescens]|uniref:Uncharacterized protein n=1 Tax=Armillaria tabescens TaxID=1929756 RepID=A0AA39NEY9_ARMTA|nr:uncharacterized protein EV420DRAFT_1040451 [Desarmillaria tabescens]KAK0464410.1 hypothetical protein EV420DRAFT_1040451 [Desarmillaria tabescens]